MKRIVVLIAFLIAAAQVAAIEGQVFIVTKGGTSIKLGLVRVLMFRRVDLENYILKTQKALQPESERLDSEAKAASKSGDFQKSISLATKGVNLLLGFWDGTADLKPLTSTKTDADGKFKLNVPSGEKDVVLFAMAKRSVPGEDFPENYEWVLLPDQWEEPLFLSNDNLYKLQSLDVPQHLAPKKEKKK